MKKVKNYIYMLLLVYCGIRREPKFKPRWGIHGYTSGLISLLSGDQVQDDDPLKRHYLIQIVTAM